MSESATVHTLTCPECSHVFTLEAQDFDDNYYEDDEPIQCPGCSIEFDWNFDEDREPQLILTAAAPEDETCPVCGCDEDECACDDDSEDAGEE